ncbi:interleukin 17-like protein [Crassostrea angulata]|uniref:interleukin 17-like protein n=1 Tax=Magallana angulata TaxID=2784310 RepID=UPI0022B0A849|nr:interleukin 17-like protein [Crassostrea angulata]
MMGKLNFLLLLAISDIWIIPVATLCRDPESLNITTLQMDVEKKLTLRNVPNSFVEKRTHTRRFNARCPSKTDVLSDPKFRTSICPTYRVTDVDVNRIPQTIVQRRCKCTECLSVLDSTLGPRAFSRCVPTFQYQMVLRRVGCASGVFEYKPVMEPFVVGCSCKLFFDQ